MNLETLYAIGDGIVLILASVALYLTYRHDTPKGRRLIFGCWATAALIQCPLGLLGIHVDNSPVKIIADFVILVIMVLLSLWSLGRVYQDETDDYDDGDPA